MIKELYNRFFYYLQDLIFKLNGSNDRFWATLSANLLLSMLYTLLLMSISRLLNIFHIYSMYIGFILVFSGHCWFYFHKMFYKELDDRYGSDKRKYKIIGIFLMLLLFVIVFVLSFIDFELRKHP